MSGNRSDDDEPKRKLTKSEAGRLGGLAARHRGVTSERKAAAARENGRLGGRPRKYATASDRQRAYLARKRERGHGPEGT